MKVALMMCKTRFTLVTSSSVTKTSAIIPLTSAIYMYIQEIFLNVTDRL